MTLEVAGPLTIGGIVNEGRCDAVLARVVRGCSDDSGERRERASSRACFATMRPHFASLTQGVYPDAGGPPGVTQSPPSRAAAAEFPPGVSRRRLPLSLLRPAVAYEPSGASFIFIDVPVVVVGTLVKTTLPGSPPIDTYSAFRRTSPCRFRPSTPATRRMLSQPSPVQKLDGTFVLNIDPSAVALPSISIVASPRDAVSLRRPPRPSSRRCPSGGLNGLKLALGDFRRAATGRRGAHRYRRQTPVSGATVFNLGHGRRRRHFQIAGR